MNRLALLINYSETYNYDLWDDDTKGMYYDVECIKNYLLSPFGGAWNENEIITFTRGHKVDLLSIITFIKEYQIDYSFVYFSGHGYLNDDVLCLEINNEEEHIIFENDLRNIGDRNLIILDCCRKSLSSISEEAIKQASIVEPLMLDIEQYRIYYEKLVNQSNIGNTILYACRKEESAFGDELGGNYTQNLLRCARRWQESCRNKENNEYLSSYLAHAEAKILVTQAQAKQHPSIEKARSGITPPFAVYVP